MKNNIYAKHHLIVLKQQHFKIKFGKLYKRQQNKINYKQSIISNNYFKQLQYFKLQEMDQSSIQSTLYRHAEEAANEQQLEQQQRQFQPQVHAQSHGGNVFRKLPDPLMQPYSQSLENYDSFYLEDNEQMDDFHDKEFEENFSNLVTRLNRNLKEFDGQGALVTSIQDDINAINHDRQAIQDREEARKERQERFNSQSPYKTSHISHIQSLYTYRDLFAERLRKFDQLKSTYDSTFVGDRLKQFQRAGDNIFQSSAAGFRSEASQANVNMLQEESVQKMDQLRQYNNSLGTINTSKTISPIPQQHLSQLSVADPGYMTRLNHDGSNVQSQQFQQMQLNQSSQQIQQMQQFQSAQQNTQNQSKAGGAMPMAPFSLNRINSPSTDLGEHSNQQLPTTQMHTNESAHALQHASQPPKAVGGPDASQVISNRIKINQFNQTKFNQYVHLFKKVGRDGRPLSLRIDSFEDLQKAHELQQMQQYYMDMNSNQLGQGVVNVNEHGQQIIRIQENATTRTFEMMDSTQQHLQDREFTLNDLLLNQEYDNQRAPRGPQEQPGESGDPHQTDGGQQRKDPSHTDQLNTLSQGDNTLSAVEIKKADSARRLVQNNSSSGQNLTDPRNQIGSNSKLKKYLEQQDDIYRSQESKDLRASQSPALAKQISASPLQESRSEGDHDPKHNAQSLKAIPGNSPGSNTISKKKGLNFEFTSKKTLTNSKILIPSTALAEELSLQKLQKNLSGQKIFKEGSSKKALNAYNNQSFHQRKPVEFTRDIDGSQLIDKSIIENDSKLSKIEIKSILRPKIGPNGYNQSNLYDFGPRAQSKLIANEQNRHKQNSLILLESQRSAEHKKSSKELQVDHTTPKAPKEIQKEKQIKINSVAKRSIQTMNRTIIQPKTLEILEKLGSHNLFTSLSINKMSPAHQKIKSKLQNKQHHFSELMNKTSQPNQITKIKQATMMGLQHPYDVTEERSRDNTASVENVQGGQQSKRGGSTNQGHIRIENIVNAGSTGVGTGVDGDKGADKGTKSSPNGEGDAALQENKKYSIDQGPLDVPIDGVQETQEDGADKVSGDGAKEGSQQRVLLNHMLISTNLALLSSIDRLNKLNRKNLIEYRKQEERQLRDKLLRTQLHVKRNNIQSLHQNQRMHRYKFNSIFESPSNRGKLAQVPSLSPSNERVGERSQSLQMYYKEGDPSQGATVGQSNSKRHGIKLQLQDLSSKTGISFDSFGAENLYDKLPKPSIRGLSYHAQPQVSTTYMNYNVALRGFNIKPTGFKVDKDTQPELAGETQHLAPPEAPGEDLATQKTHIKDRILVHAQDSDFQDTVQGGEGFKEYVPDPNTSDKFPQKTIVLEYDNTRTDAFRNTQHRRYVSSNATNIYNNAKNYVKNQQKEKQQQGIMRMKINRVNKKKKSPPDFQTLQMSSLLTLEQLLDRQTNNESYVDVFVSLPKTTVNKHSKPQFETDHQGHVIKAYVKTGTSRFLDYGSRDRLHVPDISSGKDGTHDKISPQVTNANFSHSTSNMDLKRKLKKGNNSSLEVQMVQAKKLPAIKLRSPSPQTNQTNKETVKMGSPDQDSSKKNPDMADNKESQLTGKNTSLDQNQKGSKIQSYKKASGHGQNLTLQPFKQILIQSPWEQSPKPQNNQAEATRQKLNQSQLRSQLNQSSFKTGMPSRTKMSTFRGFAHSPVKSQYSNNLYNDHIKINQPSMPLESAQPRNTSKQKLLRTSVSSEKFRGLLSQQSQQNIAALRPKLDKGDKANLEVTSQNDFTIEEKQVEESFVANAQLHARAVEFPGGVGGDAYKGAMRQAMMQANEKKSEKIKIENNLVMANSQQSIQAPQHNQAIAN